MSTISLFTPIQYGSNAITAKEKTIENVDNYFHFCGKKAVVINQQRKDGITDVNLLDTKCSAATIFKTIGVFASFLTVIIPLTMLIIKAALRASHNYKIINNSGSAKQEAPKTHSAPCVEKKEPQLESKKLEIAPSLNTEQEKLELKPAVEVEAIKQDESASAFKKQTVKSDQHLGLSQTCVQKITDLMPKILRKESDNSFTWLSKGNNLVFKLNDHPNLVFKLARDCIGGNEATEDRFENMQKAREVCLSHHLALLIIPQFEKFDVEVNGEKCSVIAEESLDFIQDESAQTELYHKYSKDLNETVRQLAIFIAKTGFCDVTPRNIPILEEENGCLGDRKVGLIDLEHMGLAKWGFIGGSYGSRGLLHCVSEEHIDLVIEEAKNQGISISEDQKFERLKEIEEDKRLKHYYEKKGIITGKEPLQVDLESLNLNLEETAKLAKGEITMRTVVEYVIGKINKLILDRPNDASLKGKRHIVLNTNHGTVNKYSQIGRLVNGSFSQEPEKTKWLNRIINALIEKEYLFKLVTENGHGYFIQA